MSTPCPPELCQLCGWALCPGLVLLLFSSCHELCQLCGWAPWLALSSLLLLLSSPSSCYELWALWLGLVLLLAAPLNSANSVSSPFPPELCQLWLGSVSGLVLLLFSSWPRPEPCQLCGWALWVGLVLLLFSSWPRPELCQLSGWALWLGSVSRPCPPLAMNSVNSVAGLCGWALCPGLVLLLPSLP